MPKAVDLQSNESDKNEDKELSDEKTESEKHNDKKENNTSPKELSKKRAEYNNKLYMDEIGKLDYYDDAEERNLIQKFMDGDKNARNRFVENRLAQVVKIARNYADRENVKKGITGMDELIAEGNVGLLEAISVIEENKKNFVDNNNVPNFDSIDGAIYMEVTNAIESLLDTVTSDKDWESAVLARTNLLNEAAKYMTDGILQNQNTPRRARIGITDAVKPEVFRREQVILHLLSALQPSGPNRLTRNFDVFGIIILQLGRLADGIIRDLLLHGKQIGEAPVQVTAIGTVKVLPGKVLRRGQHHTGQHHLMKRKKSLENFSIQKSIMIL